MKKITITKKEERAIKYAREFLHNAYNAHKNDSLGKAIKGELRSVNNVCKKLKAKDEHESGTWSQRASEQ